MAGIEMASAQSTVPGLERLAQLQTVTLHQTASDYHRGNSYTILNEQEVLFNLVEETPTQSTQSTVSYGPFRGFHMDGVDSTGTKVFSFRRPPASSLTMSDKLVISMHGEVVSVVRLERPCFSLSAAFSIDDAHDVPTLRLKGRVCVSPPEYTLKTMNKTQIGSVVKKYLGWNHEMTSRNDDYVVTFPVDLAVHFKIAVILAAVLIDFRFHDYRQR